MKLAYKILLGFLLLIVLSVNLSVTWLDRTPYKEEVHYAQTTSSLERYFEYRDDQLPDSILIGWSSVSILPNQKITTIPLAGYGARKPKNAEGIYDSVYVKTIVLANRHEKLAMVSADLLIIHPVVSLKVYEKLKGTAWEPGDIYFGATHTHSSLGAWAPGKVGELFAGSYDSQMVDRLAQRIVQSILEAEKRCSAGTITFGELHLPDLIKNRLVGEKGTTDPFARVLFFQNEKGRSVDVTYGAHATCLGPDWKKVSGDYPSVLTTILSDSLYNQASFRAGAVASMAPGKDDLNALEKANYIGKELAEQVNLISQLLPSGENVVELESYQLPLYLGAPQLKISQNLVVRPWIFKQLVGDYAIYIKVGRIGNTLMIGFPCDFSGELAVPLYDYARQKGLNLILNSFNGGYIGYVPKDKWYDMDRYETRTMAWYGHDTGAYFSEIIRRLIDKHS